MTISSCIDRAAIAAADIINSATPLECSLLGVHPRLFCIKHPFEILRQRLDAEPWKHWMESLRRDGESRLTIQIPERLMGVSNPGFDARGIGGHLISLSLLYRLTEESKYRDRVLYLMRRLDGEPDWGDSLTYGHWAQGYAVALDWLWHDLDEATRHACIETLYSRTRHVFDKWATYRAGDAFGYTWNIAAVVLGGVMAAAGCLYGERADVAPFANLAWEKMHAQSNALGPDGVSPEGIMYGGYYASYLTANFFLASELLGHDLFAMTPWLSRYAMALYDQSLPRASWIADDAFFMQGDAHGNVFGSESVLRIIATATGDPATQWLADEFLKSGFGSVSPFTFLLYDPGIKAVPPLGRSPFAWLEDHDIVIMRDNWSGTESASVVKCGPNVGHHAARRYNHPLGGGHMQPNNGEIQIFSHGGWVLTHPGYVYKNTAFHNTLLINGVGQYGENSEWFEDLPYRQRRQYPFMERAEHHELWDYCIADMTLAYPVELGLRRLRRHVLYIRPDIWIIADAVESVSPITPTLLFHTAFPVRGSDSNTFVGRGEKVACRLRFHAAAALKATTEDQPRIHTGGKTHGTMPLLRISPATAATRHLLVTCVQTAPAAAEVTEAVQIDVSGLEDEVRIHTAMPRLTVTLTPFSSQAPAAKDA